MADVLIFSTGLTTSKPTKPKAAISCFLTAIPNGVTSPKCRSDGVPPAHHPLHPALEHISGGNNSRQKGIQIIFSPVIYAGVYFFPKAKKCLTGRL
jgi:hypothetical protein